MSKKFVRSEWDYKGRNIKSVTAGVNNQFATEDLKDLFQCFEDRLTALDADNAMLLRSSDKNIVEVQRSIQFLRNMIDTTNGNTFMLTTHLNHLKEKVASLAGDLSEHGVYEMEERLDNRMDALEKRLNTTRAAIKVKPDYQDTSQWVRDHLNKLSIEQKKHICSAIDAAFIQHVKAGESAVSSLLERIKCMICDTKVGEFIDD